jgi:hypothetical protein
MNLYHHFSPMRDFYELRFSFTGMAVEGQAEASETAALVCMGETRFIARRVHAILASELWQKTAAKKRELR